MMSTFDHLIPFVVEPIAPEIIWFLPSERFLQSSDDLLSAVSDGAGGNGMIRYVTIPSFGVVP